jgi:CBS domain-containing protein
VRVRELMTRFSPVCAAESTIAEVRKTVLRRDRGPFPVVDRVGRVIGILTNCDIATAAARLGRPATRITAREAVSQEVAPCHPLDDVRSPLDTMRSRRLRRLPVVDSEGRLLGAICLVDPALEESNERRRRPRDAHLAVASRKIGN